MNLTTIPRAIVVGLDPAIAAYVPEVKYVFRTLLRIAGYPYQFTWADVSTNSSGLDIYYGPRNREATAAICITAGDLALPSAMGREPCQLSTMGGMPFVQFESGSKGGICEDQGRLWFTNDIVLTCFWLLTGAREAQYLRDRWDNLRLDGSFFLANSIGVRPLVSIYGARLRQYFQQRGNPALEVPWVTPKARAAFVFTHDVDYPQMIRWIECLRLLGTRGLKSLSSIGGVLRGTNHFWKFDDWVDFEKQLGTRPTFYFMARKGSLLKYALGTPDTFYDIHTPIFGRLFDYLDSEGCELGLHASYNAYSSVKQLRREKDALEQATGVAVGGNRHHYWHVDPQAPQDTLRLHEQAGLMYDSSLAFEFYPGFRRGICHPFRVYHPVERRELNVVELPVAWMDDHFDRRVAQNQIAQPEVYAQKLVEVAQATKGVILVDYHVRGMNHDFYPRYGQWLMDFVQNYLDSAVAFHSPGEIARQYIEYQNVLDKHSFDHAI